MADLFGPRCTVVNLRRDAYDAYIGRAGHGHDGYFGNPFDVREHGRFALVKFAEHFRQRLASDPVFVDRVRALAGKRLGCFCKPGPCHGDIIASYVNSLGAK